MYNFRKPELREYELNRVKLGKMKTKWKFLNEFHTKKILIFLFQMTRIQNQMEARKLEKVKLIQTYIFMNCCYFLNAYNIEADGIFH